MLSSCLPPPTCWVAQRRVAGRHIPHHTKVIGVPCKTHAASVFILAKYKIRAARHPAADRHCLLPACLQELARAGLRNPVRVNVAVAVAHPPKQQPEEGAKGSSKGSKDGGKGKGQQAEDDLDADVAGEAAAAAAAGAGADVEGVQKTPNSLSISYVVCEADEKIPQLVGVKPGAGLWTEGYTAMYY